MDRDGRVALWDNAALTQGSPVPKRSWPAKNGRWWLALSADGRWIASLDGREVQLLRADDPAAEPCVLRGHRGDVQTAEFSADSRLLLTASQDRTAMVWDVGSACRASDSKVAPVVLKGGHASALFSASFRSDGAQVATGGPDGTIRVWDARTGRQLYVLRGHDEAVNQVEFGRDGRTLLSASDDGSVKLWRCEACMLPVEQLRERVHAAAKMTQDDQQAFEEEQRIRMRLFTIPAFLRGWLQ
jgi:WD40 repeat protein